MDAATFDALEAAFNERSVLCIRDQALTADQYLAFARRLGRVDRVFLQHYAHADQPDIMLVSNIKEDGRDIGHADAGRVWHTDMSYTVHPPRATLLYVLETPVANGRSLGATAFASAEAAFAGLDEATKALMQGQTAVHRVSGRRKRTGHRRWLTMRSGISSRMWFIPVARAHPITGRTAIYVSEGECVSISGMDDAAAEALVRHASPLKFRSRTIAMCMTGGKVMS